MGRPADDPALSVSPIGDGVRLHVSWNGATEVERWQVLAGKERQHLRSLGQFPRTGFETAIEVDVREAFLRVRALDKGGAVLGTAPRRPRRVRSGRRRRSGDALYEPSR